MESVDTEGYQAAEAVEAKDWQAAGGTRAVGLDEVEGSDGRSEGNGEAANPLRAVMLQSG